MAITLARNPYLKISPKTDAPLDLRGDMSEFGKGVRAFGDETQAIGGGLLALGAQGLKSLYGGTPDGILQKGIDTGLEIYNRNMTESRAGKQAPNVARIEDIKGAGSLLDWGSYQLGKGLPNLAGLGGVALAGRAVAGATVKSGLKHLAKVPTGSVRGGRVVTKEIQNQVRDQIKKRLNTGTVAGGFAAGGSFEGGSAFGEMVQEGVDPADALGPSLAVGGIGGALEFTPIYAVAKRMGMGEFAKKGIREIIKKDETLSKKAVQLATEIARRGGGAGAVGAGAEGLTEFAQELTQIAAMRWAKDQDLFAALDDDDWSRLANAAATGATVGGAAAGGLGAAIGPEGVKLENLEPPPSDRPQDFGFDEGQQPLVPVTPEPRIRPQPRMDGPPIYGRDETVREGEWMPGEPRPPAGPGLTRQGQTVEGEIDRPAIGQDPNRLKVDERPGLPGPRDEVLDGGDADISPPQVRGPSFPLLPAPVEEEVVDPTTDDLLEDYHRRTTGRFKDDTPQGDLDLDFGEFDKTTAGRPYKSKGSADKAARQRGLTNYEIVERDGSWVVRNLGPTKEVQPPAQTVAPAPPDQLTVFGQDKKGEVSEIRSPATDETQQRIEAERRGQGSFLTKTGTKKGTPFKSRGAAEAAVRRRGMANAMVVEEGDGYVIQTWPDKIETTETTGPEPTPVATPTELNERLEQGEALTSDEVIESFDIPSRQEILIGLKEAHQEGMLTRNQYDSLRHRMARGDVEFVYESLQEVQQRGQDLERAFMHTQTGVDMEQLIALTGANMYKTGFAETVIKELVQNAFDAVNKTKKPGRVDVVLNRADRTVSVIDTGAGMTAEDVKNYFLRIDDKGAAKIAYLYGSEAIHLETTKDGITTQLTTNPDEMHNKKIKAVTTETPDQPDGTVITVKISERIELEDGSIREVRLPANAESVAFFQQPVTDAVETHWHDVAQEGVAPRDVVRALTYSIQPKDEGGYGVYSSRDGTAFEEASFATQEEAETFKNQKEGLLEPDAFFGEGIEEGVSGTRGLDGREAARIRAGQPSTGTVEGEERSTRKVPRDSENDELFSHAKAHAPRTAQSLREELIKFLGAERVKRLEDSGLLRIHDRAHDKGASGTFNLRDGVANLWGGSMARGTTGIGVLLHEGSHAGMDDMLGGKLSEFVADIFTMAKNGNKLAEQAIRLAIPKSILEQKGLDDKAVLAAATRNFVVREEIVAYYIQLAQDQQIENGVTRRLRDRLKVSFARSPFGRAARAMGLGFELTPEMAVEYARAALNETLLAVEELITLGAPRVESNTPGSLNLESNAITLTALDLVPVGNYVEWKNTGKLEDQIVILPSQIQMKSDIDRDEVTKARHVADGLSKELAETEVRFSNLGTGWGARRDGTIYLDMGIGNRTAGLLKPTLLREMDRALEDRKGWTGFEPPPSMASLSALGRLRADAYTLLPSGQVRAAEVLREVERIQSDPVLAPVVNELLSALQRGDEAGAYFLMDRMGESVDSKLLEEMGLEVSKERPDRSIPFGETYLFAEAFASDRAIRDDLIRLGELRSGGDLPPFDIWFERSLVTDENGLPKTLYHTRTDQTSFRGDFEAGLGIILTENKTAATDDFELNAQLRNPLVLRELDAQQVVDDTAHQIQVIHRAKRDGYDGVVLEGVIENAEEQQLGTNYIIFKPHQLRQADGTRRFDANSPEELYSIASEFLEVYNDFRKAKRRTLQRASESAGFTVQNLHDAADILGEDLSWIDILEREVSIKEDAFVRGFHPDPDKPLDVQAEREDLQDQREIDRRREAFKQQPLVNIKSMEEFIARMQTIGIPEYEYDSDATQVLLIEGIPVSLELQWGGEYIDMAFVATEARLLNRYGYKDLLDFQNPTAAIRRILRELTKLTQQRLKDMSPNTMVTFTGSNDARQRIYEKLFARLGVKLEDVTHYIGTSKAMKYQPELELESNLGGSAIDNLFEATYAREEAVSLPPQQSEEELYSFADTLSGVRRWAWTDPSDPTGATNLGEFQRWYTEYVDNLSTIEKKAKSVWDRFDLAKSRRGSKIDEINRRFFHPLKEAAAKTGLTLDEINDWLAARHIYLDDVNRNLAERASYEFTKDLSKHLPKRLKDELKKKVTQLRTGKTEIGQPLSDKEIRRRMYQLVEEYKIYEVPSVDYRVGGGQRAKVTYEWNHFRQHASGMFVEGAGLVNTMNAPNAKEIYEQYLQNRELGNLAAIFDKLTRHQLDLLIEGGNINQAEMDAMLADKQHYAPLRREAFDYETGLDFLGKGGVGSSKGVRFRGGSIEVDRPVHILQNALAKTHAAASHAQKNLANNFLYEAIQRNRPEWDGWFSIDEENVSTTMDPMGFLAQQQALNTKETDLVVIRKGKRFLIRPREQNERAIRFAAAANKLGAQAHGGAFKVFGWVNTIVRFTAVSASPAFLIANLIRDPLTAVYNMQASAAKDHTDKIVKSYKKTFAALYDVYMKGNRDPTNPNVQMVERFEKAGGRISFVQSLRDMDDSWGSFRTAMWAEKTPGVKQLAKMFKTIEDANIAIENIMRLATFTQLADVVGDAQAARIAKDLTTNFDRRGFRSQTMGLLYLFFNATVQGNVQVIKNLAQSKKLQAMVGGTIAVAGLMDMIGRALSDEDEDGKKEWDKIPLYEKERNIVLPFKIGGEYIKIPAPWVYNLVWRTGGMLSELAAGVRPAGEIATDIAAMSLTTFNPLGGGSFAQALSPTALDPFVQVVENKDFAGNTMRPINFPGAGSKSDAHLAWAATPSEYKWIAQTLNELSGGDIANSGWLDVHPSTVQNTVNFLGGGLVRFMSNIAGMPRTLMAEELEVKKVPVIRQFTARPTSQIDTQLYHERVASVFSAEKAVKEYGRGETRDPERQALAKEKYAKELRLVNRTKDVERQLRSLRQRRRAAQGRKDEKRATVLKERIEQIQREYNQAYEKRLDL